MFGKKKKGKVKLDMSFEDAIDKALNTPISKLPEFNKPAWVAKLFHLSDKPWQNLKDQIQAYQFGSLGNDVTIMQSPTNDSTGLEYFIVSISRVADKVILDYGAVELTSPDLVVISAANDENWQPLYGSKANIKILIRQHLEGKQ